jgi:hypothetical protein
MRALGEVDPAMAACFERFKRARRLAEALERLDRNFPPNSPPPPGFSNRFASDGTIQAPFGL